MELNLGFMDNLKQNRTLGIVIASLKNKELNVTLIHQFLIQVWVCVIFLPQMEKIGFAKNRAIRDV